MLGTALSKRSRVVLHSFNPVSIFICTCRCVDNDKVNALKDQVKGAGGKAERGDLLMWN